MTNPEFYQGGNEALLRQQEIFHEKVYINEGLVNRLLKDDKLTHEIANEIIDDLDDCCPYYGSPVLISGEALVSVFNDEGTSIVGIEWKEVQHTGQHQGVNIVSVDDERYLILQQVHIGEIHKQPLPTVSQIFNLQALFKNDATIVPCIELDEPLKPYYLGISHEEDQDESIVESIELLKTKSHAFKDILLGKRFRSLSQPRQINFINNSLGHVSEMVALTDRSVAIEADYGYVPNLNRDGSIDYLVLDLGKSAITGRCLGIDTIEVSGINLAPITKKGEIIDRNAGLQLVIDPDEYTREGLEISQDKVIFVPTASQEVDIEIIQD